MTLLWESMLAALIGVPLILRAAHAASDERWRSDPGAAVAVGVVVGLCASSSVALVWPLLAFGLPAAIIDVQERRLPDVLTAGLALTTAATIALSAPSNLSAAALAACLTAMVVVTVKLVSPSGMGWGDVKILPSLAAALSANGPGVLYRGVLLWVVLLGLTVGLWWAARAGRGEPVPFGPAFVAGTLAALLAT